MSNHIEIKDVGPNAHLVLPYLEDGGVVVLVGDNDRGKTEGLEAAKRLVGGKGKLTRRDGVATRGFVEGFGCRITVGASSRQSGECVAESLEGRFDLSDVIQPPVKDPAAADKVRTKAILALTGAKADPALFWSALPGGQEAFEAYVSADATSATDLVEMAARVKRDIEQAARREASQADHADGHAQGCREAAEGVDLTAPSDEAALTEEHDRLVRLEAQTEVQIRAGKEIERRAREAAEALEKHQAEYTGPSGDEADSAVKDAQHQMDVAREALERAQRDIAQARSDLEHAHSRADLAHQHEKLVKAWQEDIGRAAKHIFPADHVLDDVRRELVQAKEAVRSGVLIREASAKLRQAEEHEQKARAHRQASEVLRQAAKDTDAVLSEAVDVPGVTIVDGRWATQDGERQVFFADRSRGYRAKVAIDVAVDRLRVLGADRAILVLNQELWEGLDAKARIDIEAHARQRQVCIYTAEANRDPTDSGDVRAAVFAPRRSA